MSLERVLLACRGRLGRALVRAYRERGIETVAAFSEPDAEQGYLDDADFDAYLNASGVDDSYLDATKVLSAAMDAGCDAIHPGNGPLAGTPRLVTLAANANVGVIGADPQYLLEVIDRQRLLERARSLGLDTVPVAPVSSEDGLAEAGPLGLPLRVAGSCGGATEQVVESFDELGVAVERVRRQAAARAGEGGALLVTGAVDASEVAAVVLGDRHGARLQLGLLDRSVRHRGRPWLVELGPTRSDWEPEVLADSAAQLAAATNWIGVGALRWVLLGTRSYVDGFEPHLPDGWDLVSAVYGIDLLQAQLTAVLGQPLALEQPPAPSGVGLQARVWHGDPVSGEVDSGVLELDLPDLPGVDIAVGVDPGTACSVDTEPLLLTLSVTDPDRSVALARLAEAIDALGVGGVSTNLEALRRVLASDDVLAGHASGRTVRTVLQAGQAAGR